MTTRPIVYELSVEGADESAAAFNRLTRAERQSGQALTEVQAQNDRASRGMRDAEQNTARYAQALGTLGQGLQQASRDLRSTHPELSEFLRLSGEISSSLAQNTQAFGPWGGAIVTALERIGPALSDAIEKWQHFDQLLQETRIALGPDLVDRLIAVNNAITLVGIPTDTASTTSQHTDSLQQFSREQAARIRENISRMQAEDEEARQRSLQEDIAAASAQQQGSGFDGVGEALDRQRAVDEEIKNRFAARAEAQNSYNRELADLEQQARDRSLELERSKQEQLNQIQEQQHDNDLRRHEETLRRIEEEKDRAIQAHQQLAQEVQGYAQPMTTMFVGALSKVIAGGEDAGKVFRELLSDFLAFISQQAALKAAFEFAEAVATFPYGTAQHVAAGIAFTAVAVAAGVGSAVAAPPSTSGPAQPPANQNPQQGAPANVTIMWNSPVVTAQDRAELGRSLTQTIGRSQSRFASSV